MSEKERRVMSLMGHKQTFRSAIAMCALPPKADIRSQIIDVRQVPEADITSCLHHVRSPPKRADIAGSARLI